MTLKIKLPKAIKPVKTIKAPKAPFAYKSMPSQARGVPQRKAMPPGQAKKMLPAAPAVQPIDRSLGADSVKHAPPAAAAPRPVMGRANGLGQDHDEANSWHRPEPRNLDAARGLDNALTKVSNPTAIAAIKKAKERKGGI